MVILVMRIMVSHDGVDGLIPYSKEDMRDQLFEMKPTKTQARSTN